MTPCLVSLQRLLQDQLCHRCGSCSGICPFGVLQPDDDYFPRWSGREALCTDCGLCLRVCPGLEFSFSDFTERIFGQPFRLSDDHGTFVKAFLGYAADPQLRARSTSGGIGTALPRFMLASGRIRGAFAVRADDRQPWKPRAYVARTPEEIGASTYSKYPACSMNHLLPEIGKQPGPFLYTGIPCQIHGLLKSAGLKKRLTEQIGLIVGLFCHSCLDHQGVRDMLSYYRIPEQHIAQVIYRRGKLPGYVHARTQAGAWVGLPYPRLPLDSYRPNAKEVLTFLFKFYSPARCRVCLDATAQFADIAISDPWIQGWQGVARLKQGYSFILARTTRGLAALEEAQAAGAIVLEPFAREKALMSQAPMIVHKRGRALYNLRRLARQNRPAPDYGIDAGQLPRPGLKIALHHATYFASGRPGLRRRLLQFLLSPAGRLIIAAAFFRRRVIYALLETLKTRVTGRDATDFT
jgi:coenzyme F420 hydrogenase subunit beta